ncbi:MULTISPECIES: SufE family protein [Deinococcus]|jgi:cysteine desulfuration protein SufE|uniref:Cysteine desufuration protein SufE n=3 Tax=Deinococcus TaxID=1298 RepID=A0A0F7JPF2_9DEIO|nr:MULTISPECIES: SufE family protein [Deinococcus]AKH17592.1 cysteine desufuration protein SufE [Deinococcus soli (ex Cha et al. 2016)]ALW87989.1 cysteine desufuration protein SufE [Deinococcus actinosclerus]MDK2012479.1 SufE family protein [Deinococcus sp. 43]MDR6220532.1 cysteine desulfuration protein SufE [Deinococcus soli (ex Cha et al. 2016)]MDR6330382.1 cysteine desulfuration protein SufE [Deinococcus soli (ex Cha et al. 2016)]
MTDAAPALPDKLQTIVTMFRSAPKPLRLQALLEYSKKLPGLPEKYLEHPEFLQPVPECTSPFFLVTEQDEQGGMHLYFKVPEEAPTVRGYAGILHEALDGAQPEEILSIPDQFYMDMGLTELITPMRLRGMGAILMRLKNDVRDHARA